jgi:tetratricopeptide (TPR) repeat protein
MRHWKMGLAAMAVAGSLAVSVAAQMAGRLTGTVSDENGKPWPDVTVVISNQANGTKLTVKTDKNGFYSQMGLGAGVYTVEFQTDRFPPQDLQVQISGSGQVTQDFNFKELLAKNPQYAEAVKKQAAAQKQFNEMKVHFDAGRKAIDQIDSLRGQLPSQSPDQRTQTQQQIAQLSQTAVTELEAAQTSAGPTNSNLPTILGNLGTAYEDAGQHDKAADAFSKASTMRPTDPNFLLGAATNLAYTGKLDEAGADCDKATQLTPQNGAVCWKNIGVVLYNTNKLQDAVTPLQKATQANPNDADTWYLYGNALMNTMQSKMVDGKLTAVVNPGTVEAYQKYLQLSPNGPHAGECQQALEVLKQLGAGVETKFSAPPEKKKH